MRELYEYLSDAPHKELLREVDSHDTGPSSGSNGRNLTDAEIRERRWFARQVENALTSTIYPITPFVPKESDIIYTANGADDYDAELTD